MSAARECAETGVCGAFLTFRLSPFAFCLLPLSRVILLVVGEVSRQTAAAPAFSSESERVSDRQTQPSKRPVPQPRAAVDDCRRGLGRVAAGARRHARLLPEGARGGRRLGARSASPPLAERGTRTPGRRNQADHTARAAQDS